MTTVAEHEGTTGTDRWDVLAEYYGTSPVTAGLAKVLVDLVGVSRGETVIDLGTGTGLALIPAAHASGASPVTGIDRSLGMLKVAGAHVAEAGLANVVLIRADAARIPVPDGSFDVALAASVWQFLGYSQEVLAEWMRVLRPGGRLGFSVPGPGSGASLSADLMAKYSPRLTRPADERPVPEGARRPLPNLEEAAITAGFSEVSVISRSSDHILQRADDWWGIQWTHGIRFYLERLDPDALAMLKDEALERLVRSDTGEIVVTTNTIYCVARR
jgi:O-methyltransferase / aklanonic acid methyltransferase